MRIIFIRHGEPDYTTDTLTENGQREAQALVARTTKWDVDRFYVSTMGRAKLTIAPTLEALGRTATECDWLREFNVRITDPTTGEEHCAWDLMPQYYTTDPLMYDHHEWVHSELYRQYPEIETMRDTACASLDEVLAEYGYIRHGEYYDFVDPSGHANPAGCEDIMLHGTHTYEARDEDDDKTIVMTCHLGITCVLLGHLTGISPVLLWHTTCIAPTGVTVVNAEKRLNNVAHFRIQTLGDTRHLTEAGLPVSGYAAFSTLLQN